MNHGSALFCLAASAGLGLLQYCNLNSFRTKFILGFSFFMGLSVPQYFNGYVITTNHGPVQTGSGWVSIKYLFSRNETHSGSISSDRTHPSFHLFTKVSNFQTPKSAVQPDDASDLHFSRDSGRNGGAVLGPNPCKKPCPHQKRQWEALVG